MDIGIAQRAHDVGLLASPPWGLCEFGGGVHAHRAKARAPVNEGACPCVSVRSQEDQAQQGGEPLSCLVVAGGVAANAAVRAGLQQVAEQYGLPCVCPPPRLCTDNGLMVRGGWGTARASLLVGCFAAGRRERRVRRQRGALPATR